MQNLIENIKKHEGFKSKPYIDILVKKTPEKYGISKSLMRILSRHLHKLKLTFGYGFTFLTKEEADAVLEIRVKKVIKELEKNEPFLNKLPIEKQEILVEMAYQIGVSGVLKFQNMWIALKKFDYESAADEMLDSKWAKKDTPKRAKELSVGMRKVLI